MIINNKVQSIKKITGLYLNKFPEQLFKKKEEEKVTKFLKEFPAQYYAIRDKSKPSGVFKLKVDYDKVLEEIQEYSLFTINVSSINYANSQLLVGEIYTILSTESTSSVRDALRNPTFNLKTDIFDKRLNNIPCFDDIYSYIISNNLQDMIVEFAFFSKNVGINNERIIIYELRMNY